MKILITGSHGLIGRELVDYLASKRHHLVCLVRSLSPGPGEVSWDPMKGALNRHDLEGLDAVVHLAGENVAGRWTEQKKRRISESRIHGTRLLCESLFNLQAKPKVVVLASAIGYYGDRGEERLHEESPPGKGFLPSLCVEWEAQARPIVNQGIRVVHIRLGIVLSRKGGALAKMLPVFERGLGGVLGSGRQYMSWVAIDDVVSAIEHCLEGHRVNYPVNLVSPGVVTNREFTRVLGRVLGRPAFLRVPALALRLAFGKMAGETILSSAHAYPARLLETGYEFKYPQLEGALEHVLGY